MLEILVQGRGGQGAQTAGQWLAAAFFAEGRHVQCFASYGGARRGTPVSSHLRADDRPVRLRCDVRDADAILCFDASLLAPPLLSAAAPGALVVVDSARTPAALAPALPGLRALPIDALSIAGRHGLARLVNAALLGALARALGAPALPVLEAVVAERSPRRPDANVAACRDGWAAADALLAGEIAA
jgi:pyruvate ferredoxin oxidoreductase gamma subunit